MEYTSIFFLVSVIKCYVISCSIYYSQPLVFDTMFSSVVKKHLQLHERELFQHFHIMGMVEL